jgi:hypothetical protein
MSTMVEGKIKPWDVDSDADGRNKLLELAKSYESCESWPELAQTLIKLSKLVMAIGHPESDEPVPVQSSNYALRAVAILRKMDDPFALAEALRAAARPFVGGIDGRKMLQEAYEISSKHGDFEGQGWALFQLSSPVWGGDGNFDVSRKCFEEAGCLRGLASIDQRQGIRGRHGRQIMRAATTFEQIGMTENAEVAFYSAFVFGEPELSKSEREFMLLEAVRLATLRGDVEKSRSYYQMLFRMARESGDEVKVNKYRSKLKRA